MAKYIKRVGTSKHRYSFDISVEQISLKLPQEPQSLKFQWKRGSKRIESKKEVQLDEKGVAQFADHISLLATLYYDSKKQRFLDKNAYINVLGVYEKFSPQKTPRAPAIKNLGYAKINMGVYAKSPEEED